MFKIAKAIKKQMNNRPQDFIVNEYTVKDKKTGVEYWIGNGSLFFGTYKPKNETFPFPNNIISYYYLLPQICKLRKISRKDKVSEILDRISGIEIK